MITYSNAASELMDLIQSWGEKANIVTSRGNGNWGATYRAQTRAVILLAEIEEALPSLEDADQFKPVINELRKYIYQPETNWAATIIAKSPLVTVGLAGLKSAMTKMPRTTIFIDPEKIMALREALQNCKNITDSYSGDSKEVFNYLSYLLGRCIDLLDEEEVDLFALRNTLFDVSVLSVSVQAKVPESELPDWVRKFSHMTGIWFGYTSSSAVGGLITAVATRLIE